MITTDTSVFCGRMAPTLRTDRTVSAVILTDASTALNHELRYRPVGRVASDGPTVRSSVGATPPIARGVLHL
jgi:hypothetical protein